MPLRVKPSIVNPARIQIAEHPRVVGPVVAPSTDGRARPYGDRYYLSSGATKKTEGGTRPPPLDYRVFPQTYQLG